MIRGDARFSVLMRAARARLIISISSIFELGASLLAFDDGFAVAQRATGLHFSTATKMTTLFR